FFTWSPSPAWAAKIIVVPPIMFESHLYIFKTLATALHQEGHETHFLVSEGREVPPSSHYNLQRYPGIFNSTSADNFLQSKVSNIFSGRLTFLELFDILDHYSQNCDAVVGNGEVMNRLKEAKFDLLLVDPNEMCGFVIAHILGVQYAVFSTGLWYPAEVGAPAPLSYVPEFNSLLTDRMSLIQRIANTGVYLAQRFGVHYIVLPKYDRIMRKHGVKPYAAMADLVQGSRLWMLCTDMALEFPRPTLPHVVYIGGILTKPPIPLPQEFHSKRIGSIVPCCVEGVIMEVEGERTYCSEENSGDTGTLFKRSLRLRCRTGRAVSLGHRAQCAHEVAPCQDQPELLQLAC
ncbi:UDP glycosyltransferase 8, partial [Goodea atripinnis]